MSHYISQTLLWLFVVNLGVAYGAGLYEQRVVVPLWFERDADARVRVNRDAMRATDPGRRFWAFVTTVPLTLLTIANLFAAWQAQPPRREWWLVAALVTLIERIATFAYFIPTAARLMNSDAHASMNAEATAVRWMQLDHVRTTLNLLAWLAALAALGSSGGRA